LTWCAYLARRFELHVDPSCKDWQRLYRLPHATRTEGGTPEEHDVLGEPRRIGMWHCDPTAEDLELAKTLHKRVASATQGQRTVTAAWPRGLGCISEGILFYAFGARGWLGPAIEPGKWAVVCPWEASHTKGTRFDTSTIIFASGNGEAVGWFHCSHAHCADRDLQDVRGLFTPAELVQARRAAGRDVLHSNFAGDHHFRHDVVVETAVHSVLLARTSAFHGVRVITAIAGFAREAIWQAVIEDQPGDREGQGGDGSSRRCSPAHLLAGDRFCDCHRTGASGARRTARRATP